MLSYILICKYCKLMLKEVFVDPEDLRLLAIKVAHEENQETRGHEMDVISVRRGVLPEHYILLPKYQEEGYKLGVIK